MKLRVRWLLIVAALALCVWLHVKIRRQEIEIDAVKADLERVETYLPAMIRSELAAQEDRIIMRIEKLLAKGGR